MKSKYFLRVISLLVLMVSFFPARPSVVLAAAPVPPTDMFQLPWEQGLAWVSLDTFDNGFKRLPNSPHNYLNGGAVDFAPRKNMKVGEDTSRYWVTAAAAGTVVEMTSCSLKINHGNGWISDYQFLANFQVKLGDVVYRNQRIAVIADGLRNKFCPPALEPDIPHLHFSLRPNMRDATFAGWTVNYNPLFNRTTFTKGDVTVGQYQPLLNVFDILQIVSRGPLPWDTVQTGSVDTYRYERWSLALSETTKFTLTATPNTANLIPLLVLLDANGNEIARGSGTLTSTQSAGDYFVQVQPQVANGFYSLIAQREDIPTPTGPYVSTTVTPTSIDVGGTAQATVNLNNVPVEGYTSAEFTCTYNAGLAEVSNIVVSNLFGTDSASAINGPQNGSFIVAIAGSNGNKATTSGAVFTFDVKGLQAGQTALECKARVSKGDNFLTNIEWLGTNLNIGSIPTPTPPPVETPVPTVTQTPIPDTSPTPTIQVTPTTPAGNWLTFTNFTYGFQFNYPAEGQILPDGTDNFTRIDLPFVQGTNLREKYLEMIVLENANPCRSPLATSSMLETSETVVVNGITFLKETGGDGGVGHLHQWVAYSTSKDNVCVSLDFILHSLNAGNFPTPPPVFDYDTESAVFGQIVSTFAWLTQIPTATPTLSTPVESPTPTFTSTPDGSPTVAPTFTSTPGASPTPLPDGTVTGKVIVSKPATVGLYDLGGALVASVPTGSDGSFLLTAPSGTYTLVAVASGFLSAQGNVSLIDGSTITQPTIILPAGDIDNNNVIDQFDAMTIGMSYNMSTPAAADLNNDGIINVLDLELLAQNYRKTGPIPWQ